MPEKVAEHPSAAQPMGYSLSKWVIESLLTGVTNSRTIRVGQIVCDTTNYVWSNTSETIPTMFKAARSVGAMPDRDAGGDTVNWIPVDAAAKAILEIALQADSLDTPNRVYNLVSPATASWQQIQKRLHDAHDGPRLVAYDAWVDRLQAEGDSLGAGASLLGWWERGRRTSRERRYYQRNLLGSAPSAKTWSAVSAEDLVKVLDQWQESGSL